MNDLLRRLLFLPPQSSSVARDLDTFHYVIISVTMLGAAAVAVVAGWYIIKYRRRDDVALPPPPPPIPLGAEIGAIAGLLLLFVAFWYVGFRQFMRLRVAPEDAMEIQVQAKKWMWSFAYPEGLGASGELIVPAGRPVKLIMTSRDVIHSFFVPDFRVKQDVIPGRFTTLWFEAVAPGVHDVLCAEYCGTGHSMMRARVVVLSADDYAKWASGRDAPRLAGEPTLIELGREVAVSRACLRCHSIDGSRHIGPSFASLYRAEVPLADGNRVVADEEYLTRSMMDPLAQVHRGYPAVMPSYQGVLQPAETGALVEYIKSLRDVPAEPQVGPQPYPYDPRGVK